MRSGKLKAKNDHLIAQLIADELYDVRQDGTVWTRKSLRGQVSRDGSWRKAGRLDKEGYTEIAYRGARLKLHRIIFAKFNGQLQEDLVVDHIDTDTSNNRPDNLLLCTQKRNSWYRDRRRERTRPAEAAA